ncbi:MAG: SH3 domain-containing protein [Deltaproteobacteria bacterium]|jgi:uncharacterized protein YgiM (DUF1202 family)|nr:SH3 domain-containing protein [Deltaproteobacteria bacterium]
MAKEMSVQVKQCQLRSKPTFLGKVVTSLEYGDRVEVAGEENSWIEVSPSGKSGGWVHVSALSEKEIILNPDSKDIEEAATNDEIALAGKGFNKEVEDKYRQDKKLDFSLIDQMEKIVVSQNDINGFVRQGGLKAKGGV